MSTDAARPRRDFVSVASELNLLSPQLLGELADEAARKHTLPSQLALQKGLLDAAQIDIIETLLRPTEVVPGYEILGVLGHGGMGVVFRARQLNLKRIVALKTVLVNKAGDPISLQRFEQEAQAVAQLAHPHIVAAYDFGRHEGRLYFAMEMVTGEDIHELIRRRGSLDEWTTWGLVRQAAAGLAYAAQQGIVHRDIKPANLLLVEPPLGFPLPPGLPLVKIADFGLARWTTSGDERTRLTLVDTAVGSPHYLSPEQLRGDPVDLRTDIFALGASAFHMLSGNPPQAEMTLTQIIAHKLGGQAESVQAVCPEIPFKSAELVDAMMAHDPQKRISDYRELTRRIDALQLHSPATMATASLPRMAVADRAPHPQLADDGVGQVRKTTRFPKPKWLAVVIGIAAAVLILLAIADRHNSLGERDLEKSGQVDELFNGQNISRWITLSGGWNSGKNDEGALVLQGRGAIRRPLFAQNSAGAPQPLSHYRLTFLVDLHEASAVEIRFDLADNGADGKYLFARMDRNGSVLGNQMEDPSSSPTTISRRNHPSNAGPLHAIQLERQSQGWWVFIDEQFLGSAPFDHASPAAEFRLVADGGVAWFSDFILEELVPKAANK